MFLQFVMKAILILFSLTNTLAMPVNGAEQHTGPSYVKWGRLAMEEAAKAYSSAVIIDYKHEERVMVSERISEERFRMWLRKEGREFGVLVTISIETPSEKLIEVKMKELSSS